MHIDTGCTGVGEESACPKQPALQLASSHILAKEANRTTDVWQKDHS